MPLVSRTRAPGMAFFVVAFVVAIFAALGVDRALGQDGRRAMTPTLIIGAIVALLALTGAWGHVAESLASGIQAASGRAAVAAAQAQPSPVMGGAFCSGPRLPATRTAFGSS